MAKITSGTFVELADLLAENIRAQEAELHTYLDGKLLLASAKKSGRDHQHSHMDSGLYHLPVDFLQYLPFSLAGYFSLYVTDLPDDFSVSWTSLVELRHGRKDAAASLLADWFNMNVDSYNFHTRASSTVTGQSAPRSTSLPHTSASSNIPPKRSLDPIQYCRSWNDGACSWSLGQCRYRHVCERCDGQHHLTNRPFKPTRGLSAPGPSLHPGENAVGVNYKVAVQVAAPSCVNSVSSSLIVPCSTFAFTGVDSQQKIGLPRISYFNDSAAASSLQSFSYKSGKITLGSAHTSRSIFCNLSWMVFRIGFMLFQPCFGLLKIGHTQYVLY